jgi:hypothetical protein
MQSNSKHTFFISTNSVRNIKKCTYIVHFDFMFAVGISVILSCKNDLQGVADDIDVIK